MEIEKHCGRVRRRRFRYSSEEPSCLSVMELGDRYKKWQNRFDEVWCSRQWRSHIVPM